MDQLSNKDIYVAILFDLLVYGKNSIQDMDYVFDTFSDCYANDVMDFCMDTGFKDSLEELKSITDKSEMKKLLSGYKVASIGFDIFVEAAATLNDAVELYAQYNALSDMNEYYVDILLEIYNDSSLPAPLKQAAYDIATIYTASTEEIQRSVNRQFLENIERVSLRML
jgi:hypothetical protein